MRLMTYLTCVLSVTCLCSCSILMTQTPDEHATQFAKKEIKKCGEVEPGVKSPVVENCIFESLKNGKSFYAWYWLRPVDSVPAAGLIMNSNNELFITWYDSGYLWWGSIFNAVKCSSWSVATTDAVQKVICTLPEKEKAYLFDMEDFVSIEKQ